MTEKSLASSIDVLAQRKAEGFITKVKGELELSLKDAWRAKVAGGNAFLGDDIKNVMLAYAESIGRGKDYKKPEPTEELVKHCRATIVNDLLESLPKLKELAMMQEIDE